jgi:hypothetical protein
MRYGPAQSAGSIKFGLMSMDHRRDAGTAKPTHCTAIKPWSLHAISAGICSFHRPDGVETRHSMGHVLGASGAYCQRKGRQDSVSPRLRASDDLPVLTSRVPNFTHCSGPYSNTWEHHEIFGPVFSCPLYPEQDDHLVGQLEGKTHAEDGGKSYRAEEQRELRLHKAQTTWWNIGDKLTRRMVKRVEGPSATRKSMHYRQGSLDDDAMECE